MNHSIKRNFAFNATYQVLNVLVPLITTPYLSRTIGDVGNGLFSYTQSIANYFVLFAQLGITNYGVREIATCRDDRAARSRVFWNLFAMNLVTGGVVCAAYVAYVGLLGGAYFTLFALWSLWVVGSVIDVTWLLNGCEEFKVPMVRNLCTRLAGMLFIFVFVHSADDVWAYVFAIAAPFFVNALLVWPFVTRYVDFVRPTWRGMLSHLVPNLTLFVPVIAISLYTLLDRVMLGSLSDMSQTGIYDYSEKLSKMPMAVITALGAVVLPRMTEVVAAGQKEEARGLVRTTMWFMEACAMALMFGIVGVVPELVPVFFGDGYGECIPLMSLLSVIIPLICATNVIGVQYLVPSHRDREYTASVLAGAAINVAINVLAIPAAGALGAAVATVAAEATVLVAQAIMVRHDLELGSYLRGALPFVLIGVAMAVLIRLVAGILGTLAPTVGGLALEVCLGGAFYLVASLVWCLLTRDENFERLFGSRLARLRRRG